MGFLTKLWHEAARKATQDTTHPMNGLHDLADFAYNASGGHDIVRAVENPTNWKDDLKAGAVIGGYALPGLLAGRTIGGLAAGTLGKFAVPAAPGLAEVASSPGNPEGYINTVLGLVPGATPDKILNPLDHAIESKLGPDAQSAAVKKVLSVLSQNLPGHSQWAVEHMQNGLSNITDRASGSVGTYVTETGAHKFGPNIAPSLESVTTQAVRNQLAKILGG